MHTVIVLFKEQGSLQFLFEHLDHANKIYGAVCEAKRAADFGDFGGEQRTLEMIVGVRDDYGTAAEIDGGEIRAVVIQDLAQHLKGAAMHSLLQQRANAELQKRAASDPTLRFLSNSGLAAGMLNG